MMRDEARQWCQHEDGEYIEHLKQQIVYFNERLVTRSLEESEMAATILQIIELIGQELNEREKAYRRDYHGNKDGECIFREPQEDTGLPDRSTNTTSDVLTDLESSDTRDTTGKDDSYRSSNFYGKDSLRDAGDD